MAPLAGRARGLAASLAAILALSCAAVASGDQMSLKYYYGCGTADVPGLKPGAQIDDMAYVSKAGAILAAAAGNLYIATVGETHAYQGPYAYPANFGLNASASIIGVGLKERYKVVLTTDDGMLILVNAVLMKKTNDLPPHQEPYWYVTPPETWTVLRHTELETPVRSLSWDTGKDMLLGLRVSDNKPVLVNIYNGKVVDEMTYASELQPGGRSGSPKALSYLPLTGNMLSAGYSTHVSCLRPPCGTLSEIEDGFLHGYRFLGDHLGSDPDAGNLTALTTGSTGKAIYLARTDGTVKRFCGGEVAKATDLPSKYPDPDESGVTIGEDWWKLRDRKACGVVQLDYAGAASDFTYNPSSNHFWVATRGGVSKYTIAGQPIVNYTQADFAKLGLPPVAGISWQQAERFVISHTGPADEASLFSVIDFAARTTAAGLSFSVADQIAASGAGSTSHVPVYAGVGVFASYPSNPRAIYQTDSLGENRLFKPSTPAYSLVNWDSMHYAPDEDKLYALSLSSGTLSEVSKLGSVITELPLSVLLKDSVLEPRHVGFIPTGAVMFLAGTHRVNKNTQVELFCAAGIMGNPSLVQNGLWKPLSDCSVSCKSGDVDPFAFGLTEDDIVLEDPDAIAERSFATGGFDPLGFLSGGSATPAWLQDWYSTPFAAPSSPPPPPPPPPPMANPGLPVASASASASSTTGSEGKWVFVPGYGWSWEVAAPVIVLPAMVTSLPASGGTALPSTVSIRSVMSSLPLSSPGIDTCAIDYTVPDRFSGWTGYEDVDINNDDGSCNERGQEEYRSLVLDGGDLRTGEGAEALRPDCWMRVEWTPGMEDELQVERLEFLETDQWELQHTNMVGFDMSPAYDGWVGGSKYGDSCLDPLGRVYQGDCPDGWAYCRGMCYFVLPRSTGGPHRHDDEADFVETRCGTCQGSRVAVVGEDDEEMLRFVARLPYAEDIWTLGDTGYEKTADKGLWVRRGRFNDNTPTEQPDTFPTHGQPWNFFINVSEDNGDEPVSEDILAANNPQYLRYVPDMDDDDQEDSGWRYQNQETFLLCMNNVNHIKDSNWGGCDAKDAWAFWKCEASYPCPGC